MRVTDRSLGIARSLMGYGLEKAGCFPKKSAAQIQRCRLRPAQTAGHSARISSASQLDPGKAAKPPSTKRFSHLPGKHVDDPGGTNRTRLAQVQPLTEQIR